MRISLSGSPQWSIDASGVMYISTTWLCYQDESTANVLTGWLTFQNEVEQFAGKPGDLYKMPKAGTDTHEVTQYENSSAFVVQDVSYAAAEGRTHYEVTFSHIQNFEVLTPIGGVNVSVNDNNERTKTATYKVNIGSNPIDMFLLTSGTVTNWAGEQYLIDSSEYTAETATQYTVSITARDMSRMMIGLPQESVDSFGIRTVSVAWRYSESVYADTVLPKQGDDAAEFIGGKEGFVIQSINSTPQGVLGYIVEISAVSHEKGYRLSSTKRDTYDPVTDSFHTEWESRFRSDSPYIGGMGGDFSVHDAASFLPEGASLSNGKVTEVSFSEYVTGKYDVVVRMSNKPDTETQELEDTWDAQVSQSGFTLTQEQCGWAKSPSGEPYMMNFPPATKYTYVMSPNSLLEMQSATGGSTPEVNSQTLLNAIRNRGTIGFDRIIGVNGFISDKLRWLTPAQCKALKSLDDVHSIMLEGFVHAQPIMTQEGKSIRNLVFRPWVARKSCPLWFEPWGQRDGRDYALSKSDLSYQFQKHTIQVTMRYKINIKTALITNSRQYYLDAIRKVQCANYTSYKGVGITYKAMAVLDEFGDLNDYTEITCNIDALLSSNRGKPTWNAQYDNSIVL